MPQWVEAKNIPEIARLFVVVVPDVPSSAQPPESQNSTTVQNADYKDFSIPRRIGAGFGNILLGLGSYTLGDWLGGAIVTVVEIGGIIIMATAPEHSDPTGAYHDGGNFTPDGGTNTYKDPDVSIAGGCVIAAGVVFGFVRPFFYHRPQPKTALTNNAGNLNVTFYPNDKGEFTGKIAFTAHF
jgi:hypothetical protein